MNKYFNNTILRILRTIVIERLTAANEFITMYESLVIEF